MGVDETKHMTYFVFIYVVGWLGDFVICNVVDSVGPLTVGAFSG